MSSQKQPKTAAYTGASFFITVTAVIFYLLCLNIPYAHAEKKPPIPERKVKALDQLQKRIESKKEEQKDLLGKMEDLKTQIGITKSKLVTVASEVKKNEKDMQALEGRISKLEDEKQGIVSRLEKDHQSIAQVIMAMQRLRRTPPEAMMVRPGAPLQTAQSALLLKTILPTVNEHAKELSEDISRLEVIQNDLEKDRESLVAIGNALQEKQDTMNALVKERQNLIRKSQRDYASNEKAMEKMAAEASSLQDLMTKLRTPSPPSRSSGNSRIAGTNPVMGHGSAPMLTGPAVPMPERGKTQLPIAGLIAVRYGENNSIGARSEGLVIESRSRALVVAPMGGIVRFSSTFKNYGKLIIIEHAKGYHSIIAGLEKIDTVIGQSVEAGEPIGHMPALDSEAPTLYYELRYKGKPVNPSKTFSGLS